MIKKFIVFEVQVRTDGEEHEVAIRDITDEVVIFKRKPKCENCKHYGYNIKRCLLNECMYKLEHKEQLCG